MLKQIRFATLAAAGLVGVLGLLLEQSANAQFGGTSSSPFGSRTLGGSTSSNRTGRSVGASNPAASSGMGGQGAAGGIGMGAPTNERFVRGNRQGAFVGSDSGDGASNSYSQLTGGAGGMGGMGMGGLGGLMGNQMMMQAFRQNQQQNNQGRNQQNGRTQLRVPFKVGFDTPPVMTTAFTARLQVRYANLPALKGKAQIETAMEGETLVLRGWVQSAADKKLAEDLLSLEPGVNQVRNELEIVQPESTPVSVLPAAETERSTTPVVAASAVSSVPRRASRPLER